jgi:hypothetical protein
MTDPVDDEAVLPTPPELWGCWQRNWIEFADGTRDDTTFVAWLQTPSFMADIRIPASRGGVAKRGSFSECSMAELRALADSESSSGFTTCTPVVCGADGIGRATAEWHTRGYGIAFQPVSAFPEPGWLEWGDDPTLMIERAPSGAYTEEWQLIPGSTDGLTMGRTSSGSWRYIAGPVAILVRDRPTPVPRAARLHELIDDAGDDRAAIEALLDCEFSFGRASVDAPERFVIEASTLPWREGKVFGVDLD